MDKYLNARSRDQLKAFCKAGRLFDAQKLLEDAGTARLRKTRKWTPLFVAVDRGFHSIVEVLLRYEHAQWDLEKCLQGAVRRRRPDLAGLILRAPSWTGPVNLIEALATGDLELIQSLKESGVDLSAGDAVLRASMRNVKGVLAAIEHVGICRKDVEDQLYVAMVTHSSLGHVLSVMRYLRYGLDPHKVVPYLDAIDGKACYEGSAVSASMYSGKPNFFASLRPNPQKDNPVDLLRTAVFIGCDEMLTALLDAGFELNCGPAGGSPVLDALLSGHALKYLVPHKISRHDKSGGLYDDSKAQDLLKSIRNFVDLGAKWVPDIADRGLLRHVRDVLLALGEKHALSLLKMLQETGATERVHLVSLLKTPRMRDLARVANLSKS